MKHTSKRLLSILLCLVLMLSLIPAAYAAELTEADCEALMSNMNNLIKKMRAENKDTKELMDSLNELSENFMLNGPSNPYTISAYNTAKEIYDRYNTSDDGGDGINLTPAYEAREKLYAALGILGEAQFYRNGILGIRGLVDGTGLSAAAKDGLKSSAVSTLIEKLNALAGADPTAEPYKNGSSYYGLAKKAAPTVVEAFNTVGQAVVGTENSTAGDGSVVGAIAALAAGISMPAIS